MDFDISYVNAIFVLAFNNRKCEVEIDYLETFFVFLIRGE